MPAAIPPRQAVVRSKIGARGCGTARTQGDIYLEFALQHCPQQVSAYLIDPPLPFDARIWNVAALGVKTYPDHNGVTHLVDIVGQANYPEVADFVVEALRMGVSRKIPGDFPFEELTPDSTIRLVHARARVVNHAIFSTTPDFHCPNGHQAGDDCLHLMLHAPDRDTAGKRSIPSGTYPMKSRPTQTPVFEMAAFMAVPISHLTLIRHPDAGVMQRQLKRLSHAGIPVVVSDA